MFTSTLKSSRRVALPLKAIPKKYRRKPYTSFALPSTNKETLQLLIPKPLVSNKLNQASKATKATITLDPLPTNSIISNTKEDTTPILESQPKPKPKPTTKIIQIEVKIEASMLELEIEPILILDPQLLAKVIEELNI